MNRIILLTIAIMFLGFILTLSSLSSTKLVKLECEKLDKLACTDDTNCTCKDSPCLGVVNKMYGACEEIKQTYQGNIESCTDMCPPYMSVPGMEWKSMCLNNACTGAYINESFICMSPNNCTKR